MSMFARHICDYEVTGMFNKVDGEQVVIKRICHNVSKREAATRMKRYVQLTYADSLDVRRPIRVNVKLPH